MIYINGRFLTQKLTGVQRNAYELTIALNKICENIIVLVPPGGINANYDCTSLTLKKIGFNTSLLWEQIDLPFYLLFKQNSFLLNLTNSAPLFFKRQIVSIMDMTIFVNPSWFNAKFVRYYKWLIPRLLKSSRKVVTISENSKKDIVTYIGISESKIKVVNCAVPTNFYNLIEDVSNKGVETTLSRFGVNRNGYLLAVSSIDPRKNFSNLIKSFKVSDTDLPLLIVGSRHTTFQNLDLGEVSEKVIFTGYITDEELVALYKSARAFLYPSLYEGFGIPPLEAMACGCPVVVSNISSLPEVCGSAALYIDPADNETITVAINKIAFDDNLRQNLIAKGYEQIKKFSWSISADQLYNEIKTLAK